MLFGCCLSFPFNVLLGPKPTYSSKFIQKEDLAAGAFILPDSEDKFKSVQTAKSKEPTECHQTNCQEQGAYRVPAVLHERYQAGGRDPAMKAHQLRPLGLLAMLVGYGMQHFLHSSPTMVEPGVEAVGQGRGAGGGKGLSRTS